MQVIAKYQIAYRNKLYRCGEVFEIGEIDFAKYKNDVDLLIQVARPLSTKPLRNTVSVKAIRPSRPKVKTKRK